MIRSRLGRFGLFAAMLGITTFSAAATQAEAKWLVLDPNGEALDAQILPAVLQSELENADGSLLTTILKISTNVLCTGASLVGVKLEGEGKLTTGGKVKLTGCVVYLNGSLNKNCTPKAGGGAVGTVETNKLKGALVLVEGAPRLLVEPETGETFVTINMGASCPIGELVPVRGKLYLKDTQNELEVHSDVHLLEEDTTNSDLWVLNKTAEHLTTLDGSATTFLEGEHAGLAWGGAAE